ncbi:MAG: PhoH family protein [Bradymonadaceae bacterium]
MRDETTRRLSFQKDDVTRYVYGRRDAHLKLLERQLDVDVGARGSDVTISGDPDDVELAAALLQQLYEAGESGYPISSDDVERALTILRDNPGADLTDIFLDTVFVSEHNDVISPRGLAQKRYADAMRTHDLVFAIGPAGTGKTYLAVAMALSYFQKNKIKRIVLARPAVEAGEKLGFLPGDLAEKVNPYLRPLYDALHDMLDPEQTERMLERDTIEIAPLAFMRGRTLEDSFVIFDEAQNATNEQMKMFLTRLGPGSKAVVTGDDTQIDLPSRQHSGLVRAQEILDDIDGVKFCSFDEVDVVRHSLVQDIIRAYEEA